MDIRDQVALQVAMSLFNHGLTSIGVTPEDATTEMLANFSYRFADAFLEARLKTQRDYTITDQGELE